jgi:hypothetical protein
MPRIASSITPPDRSLPSYFVHQSLCNGSCSASTHGRHHPIPRLSANVDRSRISGIPRDVRDLSSRKTQPQPSRFLGLYLAADIEPLCSPALRNGTRVYFCSPLRLSCDLCLQKVTRNQASLGSPATRRLNQSTAKGRELPWLLWDGAEQSALGLRRPKESEFATTQFVWFGSAGAPDQLMTRSGPLRKVPVGTEITCG